jgi:predicted esterase
MATINACVLWLHGQDEEPQEWYQRFKEGVSKLRMAWVEFVLPEASITNWFGADLPVLKSGAEDSALLEQAVAEVHGQILRLEKRGIAPSRIVLGGYGPGAALALLAGRTYEQSLAGIACMSGWLLQPERASSAHKEPILLCHGEDDEDVPLDLMHFARAWLHKHGHAELECHEYSGLGHRETAEAPTALAAPKNFITMKLPPILDRAALDARAKAAKARELERQFERQLRQAEEEEMEEGVDDSDGLQEEQQGQMDEDAKDMLDVLAKLGHAIDASQQNGDAPKMDVRAPQLCAGQCDCRLLSLGEDESGEALQVVISLAGVRSMADVELSLSATQLEIQLVGAAAPATKPALLVSLPKPVNPERSGAAKLSKKTGVLRMNLRLA